MGCIPSNKKFEKRIDNVFSLLENKKAMNQKDENSGILEDFEENKQKDKLNENSKKTFAPFTIINIERKKWETKNDLKDFAITLTDNALENQIDKPGCIKVSHLSTTSKISETIFSNQKVRKSTPINRLVSSSNKLDDDLLTLNNPNSPERHRRRLGSFIVKQQEKVTVLPISDEQPQSLWIDKGVFITFHAFGQWSLSDEDDLVSCSGYKDDETMPLGFKLGCLLGRVGGGRYFEIVDREDYYSDIAGQLYLRMNTGKRRIKGDGSIELQITNVTRYPETQIEKMIGFDIRFYEFLLGKREICKERKKFFVLVDKLRFNPCLFGKVYLTHLIDYSKKIFGLFEKIKDREENFKRIFLDEVLEEESLTILNELKEKKVKNLEEFNKIEKFESKVSKNNKFIMKNGFIVTSFSFSKNELDLLISSFEVDSDFILERELNLLGFNFTEYLKDFDVTNNEKLSLTDSDLKIGNNSEGFILVQIYCEKIEESIV